MLDSDSVLDEIMAQTIAQIESESFSSDGESYTSAPVAVTYKLPPLSGGPWSFASSSNGRTVDIGNKESARISIAIKVACAQGAQWATLMEANRIVSALLEAEVSALTSKSKSKMDGVLKVLDTVEHSLTDKANPRVMLTLEYGVTLHLGNFQFAKPAAGMAVTFAPSSLREAYEDTATRLKDEIKALIKAAKGG